MKTRVPGERESLELVPRSLAAAGGFSDWTKYWELRYVNKPDYWDNRADLYVRLGFVPYDGDQFVPCSDDEED